MVTRQGMAAVHPAGAAETAPLRQRKKAKQKAALLAVATELFRNNGFEETRMEDVGRLADVSLKTVYNYFPTKQAILIDLIREDRLRMMGLYEAILAEEHRDLVEALSKLIRADISDVVTQNDKKLWRELLAAEIRTAADSANEFQENREIFSVHIRRILLRFRREGRLSPKIRIPVAIDMVYALLAYNFRIYVTSPDMSVEDVEKSVRAQLRLLVADWKADSCCRGQTTEEGK